MKANPEQVKSLLDTMDDWIKTWHNGPETGKSLHQYLQMSWTEYQEFVQSPQIWAQNILDKQAKDQPILPSK